MTTLFSQEEAIKFHISSEKKKAVKNALKKAAIRMSKEKKMTAKDIADIVQYNISDVEKWISEDDEMEENDI